MSMQEHMCSWSEIAIKVRDFYGLIKLKLYKIMLKS